MTISVIGPEDSGKTTFIKSMVKRIAKGRTVYMVGPIKSEYTPLPVEDFHKVKNCVVIVDDANAFMENYDLMRKDANLKAPIVLSKHWGRVNIFAFHSVDDAVKFFLRQSRYWYVSKRYTSTTHLNHPYIRGIKPEEFGRSPYLFLRFKRY